MNELTLGGLGLLGGFAVAALVVQMVSGWTYDAIQDRGGWFSGKQSHYFFNIFGCVVLAVPGTFVFGLMTAIWRGDARFVVSVGLRPAGLLLSALALLCAYRATCAKIERRSYLKAYRKTSEEWRQRLEPAILQMVQQELPQIEFACEISAHPMDTIHAQSVDVHLTFDGPVSDQMQAVAPTLYERLCEDFRKQPNCFVRLHMALKEPRLRYHSWYKRFEA